MRALELRHENHPRNCNLIPFPRIHWLVWRASVMAALPDYIDFRTKQYLDQMEEAEAAQARLNAQVSTELRNRDTWVDGLGECALTERPTMPSPVIDALIAGDTAEAGRLIHKYITEVYAKEQAEVAIHRQDEDADNGFYA